MRKTAKIPKKLAKQLQEWIDSDQPIPDAGEGESVHTTTVIFGKGIEADIKVCNGDNGAWIDAVLYTGKGSIYILEPSYTLLGEFNFDYDGKIYTAIIRSSK